MDRRRFVATVVGGALSSAAVVQTSASASAEKNQGGTTPMSDLVLQAGSLSLHLDTKGGAITGFWQQQANQAKPFALLRPRTDGTPSCFPLVPFGNRVRDNRFTFDGRDYVLQPNTAWDRHYLHGEGWQADWSVLDRNSTRLSMQFEHRGGAMGYNYQAQQIFALSDEQLEISLVVKNLGTQALPFGLGWHPYFLATKRTTLWAPAQKFWTEIEDFLPGELISPPLEVDFSQPKTLPDRWVNNGLQDWIGKAIIRWPEQGIALHLDADPLFRHAFIFVPGEGAPPHGGGDIEFGEGYFCFEPMSHLANGHQLNGLGGLVVLAPGASLAGSIRLRPQSI